MIKNIVKTLKVWLIFILVLFLEPTQLYSQNFKLIHRASYSSPFVIMIVENEVFDEMYNKILEVMHKTNASFFIINGSNIPLKTIKVSLNILLNQDFVISKNNIYLVIAGNSDFFNAHNMFNDDLFPSKYYINTDNSEFAVSDFDTGNYQNIDILQILNKLKKKYLWEIDLAKIRNDNSTDYYLLKAEYGLGLACSMTMPIGIRLNTYIPKSFITYDFSAYRSLNTKWKINANFALGFKIPDPQKEA